LHILCLYKLLKYTFFVNKRGKESALDKDRGPIFYRDNVIPENNSTLLKETTLPDRIALYFILFNAFKR